jgi:outer membrane lipoprotein-sorting protein
VNVWYKPPNSYRWEFLTPDGRVARVHVQNDGVERVQLSKEKILLKGQATKSQPKRISQEKEWNLLKNNYDISKMGKEQVAGRNVVVVELQPKSTGKAKQQFWIDQENGMALAVKRFQEKGTLAVYSRFTQIQPNAVFEDAKFVSPHDPDTRTDEHGYNQSFLSLSEMRGNQGRVDSLPEKLPYDFEFESADSFKSDAYTVRHYRYTDGMCTLSIFETEKPARFSGAPSAGTSKDRMGPFQITDSGHVFHKKWHDRYLTLISDVSESALQTIGQSFK